MAAALKAIGTIRRTEFTEQQHESLRLDVGSPHHLAPFLGFVGDKLTEISGRTGKCGAAQVGKRPSNLGSERAALISLLSLSTISAGVFFGAPMPVQKLAS